jgi:hypothetical protein
MALLNMGWFMTGKCEAYVLFPIQNCSNSNLWFVVFVSWEIHCPENRSGE